MLFDGRLLCTHGLRVARELPELAAIGLGWVTFQVMRRTNGTLAHKLGIDPNAAADQRGHGVGVAINEYVQTGLDQKLQVARTLENGLIQ